MVWNLSCIGFCGTYVFCKLLQIMGKKITSIIFKRLSRAFIMGKWIFLKSVTSVQKMSCVTLSELLAWSKFILPKVYFLPQNDLSKKYLWNFLRYTVFFLFFEYYPYFNIIGKIVKFCQGHPHAQNLNRKLSL